MPAPERGAPHRHRRPAIRQAHRRLGRAYAELLAITLAAIAGIGALVIWHLVRRGRLLRDRLDPPRPERWPDIDSTTESKHKHDDNQKHSSQ